ncbi:MAG: cation:proton antiporter [Deltaproteobacteria bacterium]|nr:cation:proton antiporter [Deltaproteobacteria bacterium]
MQGEGLVRLLLTIGSLLLLAPLLDAVARRARLPRVTLLLLLGLGVGPFGADLLPDQHSEWYPAVASVALSMVGFLLGGEFTLENLRARGKPVLVVSAVVTIVTFALVAAGMWLVGAGAAIALVLGAAATATDPAACDAVVREMPSETPHGRVLLGVVAVDDVWGTMVFAVASMALGALLGGASAEEAAAEALREIGGSILLGGAVGVPVAMITGRLKPGEPTRLEALGAVLACDGLASWLHLSPLLATVALGAVVANLARHHEVAMREIEGIEWPFLVLFFVLSGASATLSDFGRSAPIVAGYVLLRVLGRLIGGWIGGSLGGLDRAGRRWIGLAMLPQAGVALGMTLVAVERFPSVASALPTVVLATVVFEVVGPVLTRISLGRMQPAEGVNPPQPSRRAAGPRA